MVGAAEEAKVVTKRLVEAGCFPRFWARLVELAAEAYLVGFFRMKKFSWRCFAIIGKADIILGHFPQITAVLGRNLFQIISRWQDPKFHGIKIEQWQVH